MTPHSRLYLLTPPAPGPTFAEELAAALDAGDVACVQLRAKSADDGRIVAVAGNLMEICASRGVALVVNDRPDLAQRAGADGVHLGQQDGDIRQARAVLGHDAIIGVTCHDSLDLAITTADQGADYVAFGAFFDTATKEPRGHASVDLLYWWEELVEVPCVAIGGITALNCAPLVKAKTDFLAVSGTVWNHPGGPAVAVKELNQAIVGASD